jgi:hypothetical protein
MGDEHGSAAAPPERALDVETQPTVKRAVLRRQVTAAAMFWRVLLVSVVSVTCSEAGPSSEYLGILQVRVLDASVPDSVLATDTLTAFFSGKPDVGDCLSFARADILRDSARVTLTLWAEARRWLGPGPPPPCGIVGYRYEGPPPFYPEWFFVVANQPDGTEWVDSLRVIP